jgi:hypothetical protein
MILEKIPANLSCFDFTFILTAHRDGTRRSAMPTYPLPHSSLTEDHRALPSVNYFDCIPCLFSWLCRIWQGAAVITGKSTCHVDVVAESPL